MECKKVMCESCGRNCNYESLVSSDDFFSFWHILEEDWKIVCDACIYKIMYKFYHEKFLDIKDLVGEW